MKSNITVVLIIPTTKLGGAEKLLKNIALYFLNINNSVEIHIMKRDCSSWDDLANKCTIKYYSQRNVFLGVLKFFLSIDLKPKSYLFSSHVLTNCLSGLLKKIYRNKKIKLISRESTDIFIRYTGVRLIYYKILYYISYSSIDLLIFQTTTMEQSFKSNVCKKLQSLNTVIIPNPIIISKNEIEDVEELLTSKYIISAGRLIPEKGFDLLIKVFHQFYKKNKNYQLIILGEGRLREPLQKMINKLKLNTVITLLGQVNNPLSYFKTAEICIVSSRLEGFPNVLLEMMSQNTKVVSTLCAGDIEKIEGVKTINTNNKEEMLKALNEIVIEDNRSNRLLFDAELKKRTIEGYFSIIENKL